MSCFFQSIDPCPSPPPAIVAGEGHTRRVERGRGVNILEDARHSFVLYLYRILFGFRILDPYPGRPINDGSGRFWLICFFMHFLRARVN